MDPSIADASTIAIRPMTIGDYPQVYALWEQINGFALRSVDDSAAGIARFLERNPNISVVAETAGGRIVGSILAGHDGRQGAFYHVCVAHDFRRHGIGRRMVRTALATLHAQEISKVTLVAFSSNEVGNAFWERIGWTRRPDYNSYEFRLNEENIIRYVADGE